jgi:hypothetical protein
MEKAKKWVGKKIGTALTKTGRVFSGTTLRTSQGKKAHSISTPNTLKTTFRSKLTPNFLRGKTSRQAQEALKGIYGSSNALKVQRIEAKQKAYTSAVNSQKGKVEEAQKKMTTKLNSMSVFGSAPKSKARKILTLGLGSVSNAIKKKFIQRSYTKQQKILTALEGKKENYNQKAKKATTKITAKTGISATTATGETKTLSNVIEESKKAYNKKRIEPLIANRSKFEAATSIKKGIDNAVVAAQRTLELATRKVSSTINPEEKTRAAAELVLAKEALATANKALTTNSYKVASNTSKTLGKKLIKTQKINLLSADELTKISRGNNNAAKIRAKATAFRSGIQEQRSLSKYGSFNKLAKYSDPNIQQKLLSRIDKGAAAMTKQTNGTPLSRQEVKDLKYAVKAQSILTLFNEKNLLTNPTIKQQFNGKAKLNITKSTELTTEEKTKGTADLQVNIAKKELESSQAAESKAKKNASPTGLLGIPKLIYRTSATQNEKTQAVTQATQAVTQAQEKVGTAETTAALAGTALAPVAAPVAPVGAPPVPPRLPPQVLRGLGASQPVVVSTVAAPVQATPVQAAPVAAPRVVSTAPVAAPRVAPVQAAAAPAPQ